MSIVKNSFRERITWRMVYTVCAIGYAVWVAILSLNNIDMVNSRYSIANQRLEPAQIEKISLQELIDKCRRENKRSKKESALSVEGEDPCLSWSPDDVSEHQKVVKVRLLDEKKKTGRKVIFFYFTFLVFFLFLPLFTTYWLLAFIIYMFKGTTRPGKKEKKE